MTMEFRRHITFCRTYMDSSGMPEWPRGSRRAVSFRFDSFVTERDFVTHMMHNPAEFAPYFAAPPLHLRHVVTAPTLRGTRPYDAIEFSRWVSSNDPDHANLREEWRNGDIGAITRSLILDGAFRLSATFPVYDDESTKNFCKYIVENRFNGFEHKDAFIVFSAYAVPPHPDFPAPETNAHRGIQYQPAHPMARHISNPFAVADPAVNNNNAARPASPAGTDAGSISEQSEDVQEDEAEIPEADDDSDDDAVPEPDPDPEPVDLFGDNGDVPLSSRAAQQADPFAHAALRRISDELFDVRQEMPEAVYVRLSNSLKRRLGE